MAEKIIHTEASMLQGATIQYRSYFRTMALGGAWGVYRAAEGETLSGVVVAPRGDMPGQTPMVENIQAMTEETMRLKLSAAIRADAAPVAKPETIYYEAGLPGRLVPVEFIGYAETPLHETTKLYNVVVKLKRPIFNYERGETLHVPAHSVVVKAGRRNYHQLVRQAELPARTPANTHRARV